VTVLADPTYPVGTVNHFEIHWIETRPDLYMVTWAEPETGNTVVHVQDFAREIAYANVTNLALRGFSKLTGQITPLGASAAGYPGVDPALNEDAAREAAETSGMG
jgi:hypothetical protein